MLCNATDSTSRCARGCEQAISKRDVSTRRSGSKQYLMSQGPLKRRDTLEENALEGSVGRFFPFIINTPLLLLLLLLLLFCDFRDFLCSSLTIKGAYKRLTLFYFRTKAVLN